MVLSRILVGVTFVFSGLMKAVDPLGFTYKIEDYLIELDLTALFSLALPAALLLVTAEFALGVFLLLGIYRKWTTRLILLFMIFFTPLTLWVALANLWKIVAVSAMLSSSATGIHFIKTWCCWRVPFG